jgi:RHS repeat-associated protein
MRGVLRFAFALLLSTAALAQQSPALEKGFSPEKLYSFGNIDAINTFNGNLTLSLPLGPSYPVNAGLAYGLSLSYNSKVWDYETYGGLTRALPNRRSDAGLGWLLSLGRLIPPNSPTSISEWSYESPDGRDHAFTALGTYGAVLPVTKVAYTTDNSYLRLLQKNDGTMEVEFPDGSVQTFRTSDGNLVRTKDRLGNFVEILYLPSVTNTPCPATDSFAWQIVNSNSTRNSYVCFQSSSYPDSSYAGQVERVILPAPPSGTTARTASYVFGYTNTTISRGCHSYVTGDSLTITVPLLTSITQPDGSTFSFAYNTGGGTISCTTGTMASVTLPTKATIAYGYRYFIMPAAQCGTTNSNPNTNITGVGTRTISGPRLPTATWSYASTLSAAPGFVSCQTPSGATYNGVAPAEEMTVAVTDPVGNVTENFYSVWPGGDSPTSPNGFVSWEYGLPLSHFTPSAITASGLPVYRTLRSFTPAGYAASPKQPLRTQYVSYEQYPGVGCGDVSTGCGPYIARVQNEQTIYHDDANRRADVERTDWDGVGHYRRTITGGTFSGGNRETFVAYNTRDSEVNPTTGFQTGTNVGTFIPPPSSTPWILDRASSVKITEGGVTATTQSCFDGTTGMLLGNRVLKGSVRDTADAVVVFSPDVRGNVASETYFGGDVKNNASISSPLCTMATSALPTYDYKINHTYSSGVRSTSQYAGATFFHLNRTIDAATGFTLTSTDSASEITQYLYDAAFRLSTLAPPDVTSTTYTYRLASGSTASTFIPAQVQAGTGSTSTGIQTQYQYDALGRLWRQKSLMPDGTWSLGETLRDAAGNTVSTSATERLVVTTTEYDFTPSKVTTFSGYDPFGRPATVLTPDGKDTTFTYAGVGSTTRRVRINGSSGETQVATTESYDRQGRLITVTEAAGTGSAITTSYGYDVGGRLTSVAMSGAAGTQTRSFTYDRRGFLGSEQHPELGTTGYGTTTYLQYDSRGHARRQYTGTALGAFDLTTTFDGAERVTQLALTSSGQLLKQFAYDDPTGASYGQCSGNRCNGKLAAAARFNYVPDLGTIAVTEAYQYDGPGGRLSRRDNAIGSTAAFTGDNFQVAQIYTTLGELKAIYYPCRTALDGTGNCMAGDPAAPTTVNTYKNGLLTVMTAPTSTGASATAITYAPNGLIDTVTHGPSTSPVYETWIPVASGMARPCGIFVYGPGVTLATDGAAPCGRTLSGVGAQWSTGAYAYDGAGNIKQVGGNAYQYDNFNRLTAWSGPSGSGTRVYDNFGNTTNPAIAGTTNHIATYTYDAAGNVLTDGVATYTYDALNATTGTNIGTRQFRYLYTPQDERLAAVERVNVSGILRNRINWTLRSMDNRVLRIFQDDYTSASRVFTVKEETFWRGGSLLASRTSTGTRHYGLDHLGSPRILTDTAGALAGYQDFAPFGSGGTTNGGALQFTSHERDAANLGGGTADLPDYMHARYYRAGVGRFLSVDPVMNLSELAKSPQAWNRYAYVRNSPLGAIDPTGLLEALLYGKKYDVNPGDVVVLVDRNGRAKHVAIVAGFVKGKGGQEALVYENAPTNALGSLQDESTHTPQIVNSNSDAAGAGKWNRRTLSVGGIVPNNAPLLGMRYLSFAHFTSGDVTAAVRSVGPVRYNHAAAGALAITCDCAGFVNRVVDALDGSLDGSNGLLGAGKTINDWLSEADDHD